MECVTCEVSGIIHEANSPAPHARSAPGSGNLPCDNDVRERTCWLELIRANSRDTASHWIVASSEAIRMVPHSETVSTFGVEYTAKLIDRDCSPEAQASTPPDEISWRRASQSVGKRFEMDKEGF